MPKENPWVRVKVHLHYDHKMSLEVSVGLSNSRFYLSKDQIIDYKWIQFKQIEVTMSQAYAEMHQLDYKVVENQKDVRL